jgi:hypothetical protein
MENGEKILRATHQGTLNIAEKKLNCAVLEDGTRIISYSAIYRALGRVKGGKKKDKSRVPNMPGFLDANNLQPFIHAELRGVLNSVKYLNKNGAISTGYKAEILPMFCDVYLSARKANALTKGQQPLAAVSEILLRSFSKLGIIALIDEATGYQEIRDKIALQKILDKYISREVMGWQKRFPDEFYELIFKLNNWPWRGRSFNPPQIVGKYTNDIIYERLAPGVLDELKRLNPVDEKGRRKYKHTQWLTVDVGNPRLNEHLVAAMALMRAASGWKRFMRMLKKAFPKPGDQQEIDVDI